MVQSISQYEFIYEYILDYLSSKGLVELKFPRNTFGLEEEDAQELSAEGEDDQKETDGLNDQEEANYDFEANETVKQQFQLPQAFAKSTPVLEQETETQE